jgi:Protein of unknown function (DUF3106)
MIRRAGIPLRPFPLAIVKWAVICGSLGMPLLGSTQPIAAPKAAGVEWASLTASQQRALAPLKGQWSEIDSSRKLKWLVVSDRFPSMSAEDQRRMQDRMDEWSRLTPTQRAQTRLQFQETRSTSDQEKRERWAQYQTLSPEQKTTLQNKGSAPGAKASDAVAATDRLNATKASETTNGGSPPKAASPTAAATGARLVNPVVVQAKAGATTTLMNKAQPESLRNSAAKPQGLLSLPPSFDNRTLLPKDSAPAQRVSKARDSASAPAAPQR